VSQILRGYVLAFSCCDSNESDTFMEEAPNVGVSGVWAGVEKVWEQ
jgi:hypothetical protein